MNLTKLFTSKITLILSFLLLAAGLVAGITLIRYPQILFPEAAEVQCPSDTGPFNLYCTWDAPAGAVSYDYAITKNPNNPEVVQAESDITQTYAEFPGYPNEIYTCMVNAYNSCGSKSQALSSTFSCTAPVPTPQAPQWAFNGVWQDPWQDPDGGMRFCAVQTWFTQPEESVQHLRVEIWPDYDRILNGTDRYRIKDFTKEEIRTGQVPNSIKDAEGRFNVQFLDAIIKAGNQDEGWQAKVTAFSEGDASESSIQKSWGNHPTCRGNNMPGVTPPPVAPTSTPVPTQGACLEPYTYCNPDVDICCNNGGDYDCLYYATLPDPQGGTIDRYTCQLVPAVTPVPGTNTITGLIFVNGEVPAGKYLKIGAIPPSGPSVPYDSKLINSTHGYQLNIPSNIETVVVVLYPQFFDTNGQNPESLPSGNTITSDCRAAGDADNTCTVTTPVEGWMNKNFTITIPAATPPPAETSSINTTIEINSNGRYYDYANIQINSVDPRVK